MSTSITHHVRPLRSAFYVGQDGDLTTSKRHDDKLQYKFDFQDFLESGETLSTVSTTGGPTVTGSSVATSILTMTIEGSGKLDVTLTTSSSRTIDRTYVFRAIDRNTDDY